MSFAKNMDTHLSNKYSHKPLDSAKKKKKKKKKKSTTDAIKTASKRTIQKTAEPTGDLIGNKVADKISVSGKSWTELHSKKLQNNEANDESKERYISQEKRQQIINESRLV